MVRRVSNIPKFLQLQGCLLCTIFHALGKEPVFQGHMGMAGGYQHGGKSKIWEL